MQSHGSGSIQNVCSLKLNINMCAADGSQSVLKQHPVIGFERAPLPHPSDLEITLSGKYVTLQMTELSDSQGLHLIKIAVIIFWRRHFLFGIGFKRFVWNIPMSDWKYSQRKGAEKGAWQKVQEIFAEVWPFPFWANILGAPEKVCLYKQCCEK